ncbi:MAG TPA: PHP-associated domain-containing protein [Candidatus Hydrogenedentes bacterium]|mgnify:CR=1 FL=1|nr:PHP-associated domain-containing protein [Candidatus Hydrogenedentota bacterium]HOT50533.1 PHP-associated domain-containing protein [Candidatus Hydrogenedentota bacterium]HOV75314.1 PHP-associated domain-containing protein [Candidatus Hydrogenedentota bacterium]HPC17155.1 PHP-associated domain-containing protein [Candidatus Hydrogenedentota bacterium]HRT21056.1 PHP-associated domain-containing protein [Candidatus Hydrogenedentota bacterium]
MRRFTADLHIHTALSACADDEMTPPAIVAAALKQGLDMIAICDHNSAGNAAAVQAAAGDALSVIAGMEITTAEEAHVLGLFPDAASAEAAGGEVRETLPAVRDVTKMYGRQIVMDAAGRMLDVDGRMLFMASGFPLSDAIALIRRNRGLAVASHVDRPSHSVISQLGLFPADAGFDGIEISAAGMDNGRESEFESLGLPMVSSSDSHFLGDIGSCRTFFTLNQATFDELMRAFRGESGRRITGREGGVRV